MTSIVEPWMSTRYGAVHNRMRRERGQAKLHACSVCENEAHDRSYVHDTDPLDPYNYVPLCRKCHQTYDEIKTFPPGESHPNAKLTDDEVAMIRFRVSRGERRVLLAAEYGVCTQHIGRIVRGVRR